MSSALVLLFSAISRPVKHFIAKIQERSLKAANLILSILFLFSRIIWLGDLNYRIALSYRSVKALVEMHNWKQLLEKDQVSYCRGNLMQSYASCYGDAFIWLSYARKFLLQLRIEQRFGRVFAGWKEGRIYFPPTYKYSYNSDRYAGDDMHPNEKRRTPAW